MTTPYSTDDEYDETDVLPHARVIAAHIHQLDARLLLMALPHIDQIDLFSVRRDFAHWVSGTGRGWSSWQQAWNAWTCAHRGHPGTVQHIPARCPDCRGQRIDRRRGQICVTCLGTGRGRKPVRQIARWIPVPTKEP